jgi:hypothetical protein
VINVIYILLGLAVLWVVLSLTWRLSSRWRELLCPSWLAWMVELDNPFTRVNRAQIMVIMTQLGVQPPELDSCTYFDKLE